MPTPSSSVPNQTFSPARFGRLFGRHTAENLRGYLLAAAVLTGAMLLVMSYVDYLQHAPSSPSMQGVFFVLFMIAAGSFFSSGVFADFGDKRKGMAALTLPASHFEKFLVAWLYSLPIFLLVFVPLFYLADVAVLRIAAGSGPAPAVLDMTTDWSTTGSIILSYVLLNAAWLWGSIFFERGQFIRMGFLLFVAGSALSVLNFQWLKRLLQPDLKPAPPFTDIMLATGHSMGKLALPETQTAWLAWLPLALALLLWAAAYYRLTEKQL